MRRILTVFSLALLMAVSTWTTALAQNQQVAMSSHPFDPEIQRGRERIESMKREIRDYSCIFTKRERVKGELLPYEQMVMRVRHEPFSVYFYWLAPESVRGQQVVYIEGRNKGKLVAQPIGLRGQFGPYNLDPNGPIAMQGQRYPITNAGLLRTMEQLVEEGMRDRKHPECSVRYYKGARVEDRVATVTELSHPKRPHFDYYMARIYVDNEWNLPIRLESFLWPTEQGGKPIVLEEYTYTKLKFNNGFTDAEFTIRK